MKIKRSNRGSQKFIRWFDEIDLRDVGLVGGKNASLGELYQALSHQEVRVPEDLCMEILAAYDDLIERNANLLDVAVRSSATAEDLPQASFAGQQETYLNVQGHGPLLDACKRCFASLFTDRAISYRADMGFDYKKNGLGENIVQGAVNPDEIYVFKPTLEQGFKPIVQKKVGTKEFKMVYDVGGAKMVKNIPVSPGERSRISISDNEILTLGVDRDSEIVSPIFDERNSAVKKMIVDIIRIVRAKNKKIGICGQAPSDYPDFASFLVENGISSISLNTDAVMKTTLMILKNEQEKAPKAA